MGIYGPEIARGYLEAMQHCGLLPVERMRGMSRLWMARVRFLLPFLPFSLQIF